MYSSYQYIYIFLLRSYASYAIRRIRQENPFRSTSLLIASRLRRREAETDYPGEGEKSAFALPYHAERGERYFAMYFESCRFTFTVFEKQRCSFAERQIDVSSVSYLSFSVAHNFPSDTVYQAAFINEIVTKKNLSFGGFTHTDPIVSSALLIRGTEKMIYRMFRVCLTPRAILCARSIRRRTLDNYQSIITIVTRFYVASSKSTLVK